MKRSLAILLSVILLMSLVSCGTAQKEAEESTEAQDKPDYTALCQEELDSTLMQGAVYATVNGEEVLSLAKGKADKTAGIDNSADVVYQFASVTKQFTAAAILLLYEDGKLDLQDTVDRYFPDCPGGSEITVHMLLCMRSGLTDYVNMGSDGSYTDLTVPFDISADKTSAENRKTIKDWIFSQELIFEPDSQYSYSNSNYLLLGEIIEQISGMTYREYLTEKFFRPLGMTSAGFFDAYDNDDYVVAKAYKRGGDMEWTEYPGVRFGCGDLMCSPKDMAKWATALMNGEVLSDSSWKLMTTAYSPEEGYGYGLAVGTTEYGIDVYCHSGRFTSYFSMVVMVPEAGYAGVTASNHSDEAAVNLCAKLAKLYYENVYLQ